MCDFICEVTEVTLNDTVDFDASRWFLTADGQTNQRAAFDAPGMTPAVKHLTPAVNHSFLEVGGFRPNSPRPTGRLHER